MSSLHHLPRRDLEALSAYLDGELGAEKARHLETRLEQDQELRAALVELRSVRDAVRGLPSLHPPRSLVLTPDKVGRSAVLRAYPALRLATALATTAFLFVSGANVVLSRGLTVGARAPAEAPMMAQAPPPVAPGTEMVEVAGAPLLSEAPSLDTLTAPTTPEAAEMAAAPETTTFGEGLLETPQAAAQPAPAERAIEPLPTDTPAIVEMEGLQRQPPVLRTLVWLQLGLGVLVVGLAMLTLRAGKQAR